MSTAQATAPRAQASTRRRSLLLLACCLALAITSIDLTIVNVALPVLARSLHAGLASLQWVIDGYMLALAALLIVAGSLGDRLGRRTVLQGGLVTFALASLACSLAPSVGALIAFRIVQGVGAATLVPNALSTLTNVITDRAERARAVGIWSGVYGLAAAAGPICGGLLVDGPGWRSIFWVNLPVVALTLWLVRRYAPETRAPRPRRIDAYGQLLIALALASATAAFIEAPSRGWSSPPILGAFALALAALAAFVTVERRVHEPLIDMSFFRSPPFSGAAAVATLAFAVFSGFLLLNTLYLQEVRGASALRTGIELLPAMAMVALFAPVAGHVVARHGSRSLLVASGFLMGAGAIVLALFERPGSPYLLLAGAFALVGLGMALVNPPVTHAAVSGMPQAQAGVASAITSSTRQFGNAMGVAIIGSILTSLLAARITTLESLRSLAPATRHQLALAASHGALVREAQAGHAARALLDGAFVDASHVAWWVAGGLGLAIAAVGYLSARSPRRVF